MSAELAVAGITSGSNVQARLIRNSDKHVYNVTSNVWEALVDAHATAGQYDIACTEQGTSGYYVGSIPSAITVTDILYPFYFTRTGTSPTYTYVYQTADEEGIEWVGTANNTLATGLNWITLADFKTFYDITDSSQDAKINLLIPMASVAGNSYLNRTIKTTSFAQVYRGNCMSYLNLGNWPVQSLTTVTFDYADAAAQQDYDGGQFVVNPVGTIRFRPDSSFTRSFSSQWIKCTFTAGVDTVPADLQLACMYIIHSILITGNKDAEKTMAQDKNIMRQWQPVFDLDNDPLFAVPRSILDKYKALVFV